MKLLFVLFATLAVASAGFDLKWFDFSLFNPTTTKKAVTTTTTTTKAPTTTTKAPTTTSKAPEKVPDTDGQEAQVSRTQMDQLETLFNLFPDLAAHRDEIINSDPSSAPNPLANDISTVSQQVKDWIKAIKDYLAALPPGSAVDFFASVPAISG